MVVWLASYPRSGNTFFRRVVQGSFGLPTYAVYPEGAEPALDITAARLAPGLHLLKSHELPRLGDFRDDEPVIYLVRDGRDAVLSHAHYALDFAPKPPRLWRRFRWRLRGISDFEGTLERLIVGKSTFGSWQEHVLSWIGRPHTTVMRFEELISRPVESIQGAFRALKGAVKLPPAAAAPVTFETLNKEDPKMFRKGKAGGWREEMSPRLQKLFWRHNGEAMKQLGYARTA